MKQITLVFSIIVLFCVPIISQEIAFKVNKNVLYASPEGFDLTMDIYKPLSGKDSYPVMVIWHGGAWLANSKQIMSQASEYLVQHGELVVCNVNYRLLGDQNNSVTLNEIVEDVLGSLLWIKEHISDYGGDASQIAITGDSAGGHLAAMVLTQSNTLVADAYAGDNYGFNPSWMPNNMSVEQIGDEGLLSVQAAILSYPVINVIVRAERGFETKRNGVWKFAGVKPRGLFGNGYNLKNNPDLYELHSPILNIPNHNKVQLPPQFVHVGSNDKATPPEEIETYVSRLKAAGQPVEFSIYEGLNHAYLDSGCSEIFGHCFEEDAIPVLNDMILFLQEHLDRN